MLKKSGGILCEGNVKENYDFIIKNHVEFGVRWLLNRLKVESNAYYFYKNNKFKRLEKLKAKQAILDKIAEIYHALNGVPGYRMMADELEKYSIFLSGNTVYSYMSELGLKSIVRRKYVYKKGEAHKVFANLLKQNFTTSKPNKVWCTDFTYLHLSTGEKRYNCTILDLFDRSVVASLNSHKIDSELAINTLKIALNQAKKRKNIILHSDQGSQYTSKKFVDFCSENGVIQSMSRAGCPYDNAPMERFYNTLKNEFYYLFSFNSDKVLNACIYDFIFTRYNHSRPHSFNNGLAPLVKRWAYKYA
ncbi:MAG TPA: IS3 family transposase [Clostridia bacterium]|nr:IS3 family transposase [Clostridia bacterium]